MIVEKKEIAIKENEKLEAIEIYRDKDLSYYSYNYMVKVDEKWKRYIRWDNFQKQPHVDRYDETGNLVTSEQSRDKSLKEVLELVDIFGKNLISMDISRV